MKISKQELDDLYNRVNEKPKKKKKPPKVTDCPLEFQDQENIFKWADMMKHKYPELELLNGSLNGVRLTIGQATKAKRSGMKKGFPDMNLPVPRGFFHGLYIELKREKGGVVSKEQKWWRKKLKEQKYLSVICKGYDESIRLIQDYLDIKI